MKKMIFLISCALSLSFLVGCGEGEQKEPEPPQPSTYGVNTICEYGEILLDSSRYEEGSTVKFEVIPNDYNYLLDAVNVYTSTSKTPIVVNDSSFVMPAENVTIEPTFKHYTKRVKMIAHRGMNMIYDEKKERYVDYDVGNTYEAFMNAAKVHFYGMETDVHQTKDGVWVCTHDLTFNSGGAAKRIAKLTYDEIQQLPLDNDLGLDRKVCSLEDYLKIGKKYHKVCLIEFKESLASSQITKEQIRNCIDFVESITSLDEVMFISFHMDVLEAVRKYRKEAQCQYLISASGQELITKARDAISHNMDGSFYADDLTKDLCTEFHAAKLKVNNWTINQLELVENSIAKGSDYVTSDGVYFN